MPGFIILAGYGLVLFLIYFYLKKKGAINNHSIKNMIFAGGRANDSTLIFSVLAAWMWTTSIFGASEAYTLYGIWGPLGYVIGACIAFAIFVPLMCKLRKQLPGSVTYLDLMEKRFGKKTKFFFYIFAFIVSAYVLIEQAVGVAYVLERFFGSSFKWVAFFSVMLATAFICVGGMKSLLASERITSYVIIGGFVCLLVFISKSGTGFREAAYIEEPSVWFSSSVIIPAIRYFVMAIVIGFSQLTFDPAYYIKGRLAGTSKQLMRTYMIGGILLWGSLSLVSSIYLGRTSANAGTDVTSLFSGYAAAIFAIIITFIGISTVAHYLMGMLGIFTTDYYSAVLRPKATSRQKLVFGRVMTVAIGIFCALVAISLENISLLTIDVFCAIFFAAPCGPLLIGYCSKRTYGNLPILATSLGVIGGIIIWIAVSSAGQWDQFLGMAGSLGIPLITMGIGSLKGRKPVNGK